MRFLIQESLNGVFLNHIYSQCIQSDYLKNCFDDPREIAEVLAERTRSEVVQVIGKKIVLYKPAKENSKIVLP